MAVSIIWSLSNGGEPIIDMLDHGNLSNGATCGATPLYIRHDGSNNIVYVGLYIRPYSGTYSGSFTAQQDLNEMITWGNSDEEDGFGGFFVNMNATGGFPEASWPTHDNKLVDLGGGIIGGFAHCTGQGDSEGNAVELSTVSGAAVAGEIQPGSSPNVRIQVAIQVPVFEDTIGIRQWDQVLRYSYTS
jgi:hypothetical protein